MALYGPRLQVTKIKKDMSFSVQEQRVLQNVVRQFDGMAKIEVLDILHKIETLLADFSSPLHFDKIRADIEKSLIKIEFSEGRNRGDCSLEDSCQFMTIYVVSSLFPESIVKESLYFVVNGQYELIAFNNRNIEESFANMHLTSIIHEFLKNNNVTKRNPVTKRLLLLELLDQVTISVDI